MISVLRHERNILETDVRTDIVFHNEISFFKISKLTFWTVMLRLPGINPQKFAADDILIFYFYLSKKIRLDFSCEDSLETSSLIFAEKQ